MGVPEGLHESAEGAENQLGQNRRVQEAAQEGPEGALGGQGGPQGGQGGPLGDAARAADSQKDNYTHWVFG